MSLGKKLAAEALGTAWLVIGGCGTAILAGQGVGLVGIALAFGLTVVTMAYAIGHISGCHLNPAVSVGLFMAKRFDGKDLGPYIAAQIAGALVGAGVIALIVKSGGDSTHLGGKLGGFAANGFGDHSPDNFKLLAALVTEAVMTFFFLVIILGATSKRAPAGFAPLAIGLGLALIHLISIPVTNTSVNPARSISQAVFAGLGGDWGFLKQIWLFVLAPAAGAAAAGVVYPMIDDE
ncbi:MAG: aquaporin Z [Myxococcales bacterium]|nr:aquaporin Z [Myxococcales bacterium]